MTAVLAVSSFTPVHVFESKHRKSLLKRMV